MIGLLHIFILFRLVKMRFQKVLTHSLLLPSTSTNHDSNNIFHHKHLASVHFPCFHNKKARMSDHFYDGTRTMLLLRGTYNKCIFQNNNNALSVAGNVVVLKFRIPCLMIMPTAARPNNLTTVYAG